MTSAITRSSLLLAAAAVLAACSSTPPPAPKPAPVRQSPAPSPAPAPGTAPAPAAPTQPAAFIRPADGPTLARFDGKGNKGLDIGGKAGDPVLASADGRVVFVGGQLRGYGNMVIVKHNDTFLTAYAHNQKILVKEKDTVRQGQTIAEMGKSGTDRVKLHFEVRKQGVAVDPQPYLDGKAR
ncbi:MAG: peptidoglycan DD-metalloendopeptidase family protein [Rhodocyclaceae bacterium]|nr:peptidoglycan DD-metalloendopeptidase family protein [Rhodocyclaceae bacterium]MDQ8017932.1 peptidoglycan DD-metalloendopeptidase family protein [Pseudomonadota bacterium]